MNLARNRARPLFDQLALLGEDNPTIYEEVSDFGSVIEEEVEVEQESPMADNNMDWLQDLLQGQQDSQNNIAAALTNLAAALGGNANNANANANVNANAAKPLRMEDVYEFKPGDSPDDPDYFLFSERISDLVGQFGDNRVRPALLSCLRNARARQWYTSLSNEDKELLGQNCQQWKNLLKRDFGIRQSRARMLTQREKFSFSQNRPILAYYNTKLAWLKVAGVEDEDQQCVEIR